MKCVLLGDIGRPTLYHVGDEAMTEVALAMLRRRGVTDVTLAAVDPPSASALYGLPAVRQVRYSGSATRAALNERLAACTDPSARGAESNPAAALDAAIGACDAVVIAGGGNLNSLYRPHLYARVTAARLAQQHGKPLIVSSQTIGPHLDDEDRALTAEIVAAAELFGVRDPNSWDAVRRLAPHPERVVLTGDDALLLAPGEAGALPDRFIAASFAAGPETSGFDPASYPDRVGALFDELANAADADVLLVPHAGSLNPATPTAEQRNDRALAERSTSGRVHTLPAQTARATAQIAARSILSLSTRYHPTVFAPTHAVPTVGIALSHYSTVRMTGSLGGVGLDDFLLTAPAWSQIVPACLEAIERTDELRAHLGSLTARRILEQEQWWDAALDALRGAPRDLPARSDTPRFSARGPWTGLAQTAREEFALAAPERERVRCLRRDLDAAEGRITALQKKVGSLGARARRSQQRAEAAESRRAVRAADRLGALLRRLRRR